MKKNALYLIGFLAVSLVLSCHGKKSSDEEEDVPKDQVQTPVTVTSISTDPIIEYAELNATSSFLQDNIVKSNINGYIKHVNTKIGSAVTLGQVLFVLKTKEAESLGNTINRLDSTFHFSGVNTIRAAESGFITELPHQVGDYVQDGEQLAVISNSKSFGFVLNLPYELRRYALPGKAVDVILPDSTHLQGTVASFMPALDSVSQTQRALIKVASQSNIPENLIARVRILKTQKTNATSLPKQAILSDESQSSFWVMKMMDSVTAVKVPITIGIQAGNRVEILRPTFTTNDKIVLTGNYGLQDTAKVKITAIEK